MFVLKLILLSLFALSNANKYLWEVKQFEVPVDHFNLALNKTFQMRYLVNDTYWRKNNGPIFFYTGNEGSIDVFAKNTGFMWDIAEEFKALLVFAEHRYYGQSQPFGKDSNKTENIGYLSSSQALADFADLISHLQNNKNPGSHPVIAFGGSYGGMLAAWIRMKYPHLVEGAIAASAPIHQFTDMVPCDSFNMIITSSFRNANDYCPQNINASWPLIRDIIKNETDRKWLESEWHLCHSIVNKTDTDALVGYLTDMYTNIAMVNYPYDNDFLVPLPGHPVDVGCSFLDKPLKGRELLKGIGQFVNLYANYTKTTKCVDFGNVYGNLDASNWDYQACTEMVMPICSTGEKDMFEPEKWDLEKYTADCKKKYHVVPQPYLAQTIYGGNNIRAASNIVFSNGLYDPWASGGVLNTVSESVISVIIVDGAHHVDLRGANKDDTNSVKEARELHKNNIRRWIREYRARVGSRF